MFFRQLLHDQRIVESITKICADHRNKKVAFVAKSDTMYRSQFTTPPDAMDDSKARQMFAWSPQVTLLAGLTTTIMEELD